MILRRLDWTGAQGTYTSALSPCTERIARLDFAEDEITEQANIGLEMVATILDEDFACFHYKS
jgi:hypothetical protein